MSQSKAQAKRKTARRNATNATHRASKAATRAADWSPAFLAELRRRGIVKDACRAAGIDRSTAYRRKDEDKSFADAWKNALDDATDLLEREAWRRAAEGEARYVLHQGKPVEIDGKMLIEREYSDTLLVLMLKANRPAKYRERAESLNMNVDVSQLTDEQLERIARGEDARLVIASPGAGGDGTPPPAESNADAEQVARPIP